MTTISRKQPLFLPKRNHESSQNIAGDIHNNCDLPSRIGVCRTYNSSAPNSSRDTPDDIKTWDGKKLPEFLTFSPLKMDGWSFLSRFLSGRGMAYFQGPTVSFREGISRVPMGFCVTMVFHLNERSNLKLWQFLYPSSNKETTCTWIWLCKDVRLPFKTPSISA